MVFGTRPEAIKLAPVIQRLRRKSEEADVDTVVCVTAQHRQMLDQVLTLFDISVDHDLDVMEQDQTPTRVASEVLSSLEGVLAKEQPDWVVVQGDTTTVVAASLASFYAGVPVAHVEAGLRTHDRRQPFPEEIHRRVAGVIADLHFAPTALAKRNLLREGVPEEQILITGNPVIDALHQVLRLPPTPDVGNLIESLSTGEGRAGIVLVTAHRRENFGAPMESIARAILEIAERYMGRFHIVYPVHPNPSVSGPMHHFLDGAPGVILLPPLDYLSIAHLMREAHVVLTDSGGIQEEAPALGKPVLVLRDITERPEAVEAGTVKVIGTERGRIVAETAALLDDEDEYSRMARSVNPYGDGRASERIVASFIGEDVEEFLPAPASAPIETG